MTASHDLRMVMQSCSLADEVYVETAGEGDFLAQTNRSYIPTGDKNVAVKAARAFYEELGAPGGAHIRITKRIPVCAGLGGGSADAAAVLTALNELHGGALGTEQLMSAALRAGSDVPFCLAGGTALAEGRGEVLTPLPPLPAHGRGHLYAALLLLHARALCPHRCTQEPLPPRHQRTTVRARRG